MGRTTIILPVRGNSTKQRAIFHPHPYSTRLGVVSKVRMAVKFTNIIGLGGSVHDLSCCLLTDGQIVRAVEEERLSREKNALGVRSQQFKSLDYCLQDKKLTDIDLFITNDIFSTRVLELKGLWSSIKINHHLSHAASSYYTSGFDEAAILVVDGGGSKFGEKDETVSLGIAQGNEIHFFKKYYDNSVSLFYSYMMYECGFKIFQEGKVMGLAPYGTNTYVNELSKYIQVDLPKKIRTNCDNTELNQYIRELISKDKRPRFRVTADIAYAAQYLFEDSMLKTIEYLYEKTKLPRLCYAGGAALNSVLNGKIKKKTGFKEIYVFPAAGDSGAGIGAALYGYYNLFNHKSYNKPRARMKHCYFGITYSNDKIIQTLNLYADKLQYKKYTYQNLFSVVAKMLHEGHIIGWFQDGSEIGPRALGNRSILASPCISTMKDTLNRRVKFRESFRPFAPVTKIDSASEYFEAENDNTFMLFVEPVKGPYKKLLPAVTHIDGSARLQTVSKESNYKLYCLLDCFQKLSQVPVLLNTSFNIKGEPIVETPDDALEAFLHCDMDAVVIEQYVITKSHEDRRKK